MKLKEIYSNFSLNDILATKQKKKITDDNQKEDFLDKHTLINYKIFTT